MGEETETRQPIVETDEDQPVASEGGAVIIGLGRGSEPVPAAMDPDHDWGVARPLRSPDVQRQAVLADRPRIAAEIGRAGRLQARRAECDRRADPAPERRGLRRAPAEIFHGRGGIGYALEDRDLVRSRAGNQALFHLHDGPTIRLGAGREAGQAGADQ